MFVLKSLSYYRIKYRREGVVGLHLGRSYHVKFMAAKGGDPHEVGIPSYHCLDDGLVTSWDVCPADVFAVGAGLAGVGT